MTHLFQIKWKLISRLEPFLNNSTCRHRAPSIPHFSRKSIASVARRVETFQVDEDPVVPSIALPGQARQNRKMQPVSYPQIPDLPQRPPHPVYAPLLQR